MKISAIVAMSENRVIGCDNRLPWRIPSDLKRFKILTMGHPIIMGRKTFESIGRVLPGRENIIVTRQLDYRVLGAVVVHSFEEALKICVGKTEEAFVIGGAELYKQSLEQLDRLYLTEVHQVSQGDIYFPKFSKDDFKIVSSEDCTDGSISYTFMILDRI